MTRMGKFSLLILVAVCSFLGACQCKPLDENLAISFDDPVTPEESNHTFGADDIFYTEVFSLLGGEESEQPNRLQAVHRFERSVVIKPTKYIKKWSDGKVQYSFAPDFGDHGREVVRKSMDELEYFSCIQFEELEWVDEPTVPVVKIVNHGGCMAHIGMQEGGNTLGLSKGCLYNQVVLHELFHALGILHEHGRPDRDEYIKVFIQNAAHPNQFSRYTADELTDLGLPYDYFSVMHYDGKAFSNNKDETIETLNPKFQEIIGKNLDLSFGDVKTVNLMYECKPESCSLTDDDCPGDGFVSKDCTCWCTDFPAKYCFDKDREERGVLGMGCIDKDINCPYWSKIGSCTKYRSFMHDTCKLSCTGCVETDEA